MNLLSRKFGSGVWKIAALLHAVVVEWETDPANMAKQVECTKLKLKLNELQPMEIKDWQQQAHVD